MIFFFFICCAIAPYTHASDIDSKSSIALQHALRLRTKYQHRRKYAQNATVKKQALQKSGPPSALKFHHRILKNNDGRCALNAALQLFFRVWADPDLRKLYPNPATLATSDIFDCAFIKTYRALHNTLSMHQNNEKQKIVQNAVDQLLQTVHACQPHIVKAPNQCQWTQFLTQVMNQSFLGNMQVQVDYPLSIITSRNAKTPPPRSTYFFVYLPTDKDYLRGARPYASTEQGSLSLEGLGCRIINTDGAHAVAIVKNEKNIWMLHDNNILQPISHKDIFRLCATGSLLHPATQELLYFIIGLYKYTTTHNNPAQPRSINRAMDRIKKLQHSTPSYIRLKK